MLKEKIIEELQLLSSVMKELSPLVKKPWIDKIYLACKSFQDASAYEDWEKKISGDIQKIKKIVSAAKRLEVVLADAPSLPWWYDEGFLDARWHLSNGIKESVRLCDAASSFSASYNKNDVVVIKPEYKFYYDLACVYEEFEASKAGRLADYQAMPSLQFGIMETSTEGQKYYIGEFYMIVSEIWTNCLGLPLCSRRENKSTRFIDSLTRERMDSSSFGKRVLAGIVAGQKTVLGYQHA